MMNNQTAQIAPPFFVFEDNDLSIFRDMQSVQTKLESVDIESVAYRVFDSLGSLLSFKVIYVEMRFFYSMFYIKLLVLMALLVLMLIYLEIL